MPADLALALIALDCPAWRWMPGMLRVDPISQRTIRCRSDRVYHGWLPVLTDPATLGCLLGLVRDAWGDPGVWCEPDGGDLGRWAVYCSRRGFGHRIAVGPSEAAALIAALEAAPGVGRE